MTTLSSITELDVQPATKRSRVGTNKVETLTLVHTGVEDAEAKFLSSPDSFPAGGIRVASNAALDWYNDLIEMEDNLHSSMLYFDRGDIVLVDVKSEVHEAAKDELTRQMKANAVVHQNLFSAGEKSTRGGDGQRRQADVTFRPRRPPPAGTTKQDYVTFVIEIGHAQRLPGKYGLRWRKNQWFLHHPTVEIVLLIYASPALRSLQAEVWHRGAVNATATVSFGTALAVGAAHRTINIDSRRCLGLAVGVALPAGMPANVVIDLDLLRAEILEAKP